MALRGDETYLLAINIGGNPSEFSNIMVEMVLRPHSENLGKEFKYINKILSGRL